MRFLMVHRMDESQPEAWNPSPEFIDRMGAFIGDWANRGILITAEGVHPSAKGAKVRKGSDGISSTDGPFTEAKEVIGGFALINADSLQQAVGYAQEYADLFGEIEVEVRQIVELEDLA